MNAPAPDRSSDRSLDPEPDPRRALPSVEQVIASLRAIDLPHALLARIARTAVDNARASIDQGERPAREAVFAEALDAARRLTTNLLGHTVNATGVLLHTNLGRAPLGAPARAAMLDAAGAVNIEYDIERGTRGSRHDHAGHLLAAATNAEAGMVVNNNAAAVMLVLAALAAGREVVVSRGELVEIGGGFRVPDVLRESGARLVEVGTTNRTRADDFFGARSPDTAMFLRIHASNYRMVGFTEQASISDLAGAGVDVVVDAGSGLIDATTPWLDTVPEWLHDEPGIRQCLADGAALVTFSGDKLLGGPQAGVIVGRADLVDRCRRHPLARALRADKITLAGLQSVAWSYLENRVVDEIPLWEMASASLASLHARAEAITRQVPGAKIVTTQAAAGGGSVPGLTIESVGVGLLLADPDTAHATFRTQRIVGLVRDSMLIADLRSVDPDDDLRIAHALADLARA